MRGNKPSGGRKQQKCKLPQQKVHSCCCKQSRSAIDVCLADVWACGKDNNRQCLVQARMGALTFWSRPSFSNCTLLSFSCRRSRRSLVHCKHMQHVQRCAGARCHMPGAEQGFQGAIAWQEREAGLTLKCSCWCAAQVLPYYCLNSTPLNPPAAPVCPL